MTHPEKLYKYTSSNTALIVLQNSRLRWSSPLLFNDPAEFQRMPRFEPTIAEASKEFPETLLKIATEKTNIDESTLSPSARLLLRITRELIIQKIPNAEIIAALATPRNEDPDTYVASGLRDFIGSALLSTARVICLTTNHSNDAMWANYAEGHKGCVLGFRHIPELSTPFLEAKQTRYSESPPVVGAGLDFLLYGDTKQLRESTMRAICYTKKSEWAYEQEWRAITWRPNEGDSQFGDYKFHPNELESVTLGTKISPDTELIIKQLLRDIYPSCSLYRLEMKNGETIRTPINHCVSDA
ncbi:DUF2971 domain-containing protein [Jeongeupia sp. USM3]|uniref:DUF2971 domain-containing protein n=1 Tax=Jeongeupia sp. USM3 TaxID=1906741 RepID=UPI00143B83CF|nr:DUF2971 domain-containing protein [Jeongeupia sp. USM3]